MENETKKSELEQAKDTVSAYGYGGIGSQDEAIGHACIAIAEELHRIADALEPLNTMAHFNNNIDDLRKFFSKEQTNV